MKNKNNYWVSNDVWYYSTTFDYGDLLYYLKSIIGSYDDIEVLTDPHIFFEEFLSGEPLTQEAIEEALQVYKNIILYTVK